MLKNWIQLQLVDELKIFGKHSTNWEAPYISSGINMTVGNGYGNTYGLSDAYLKDIQYYNRILTDSEIKENYEIFRRKVETRYGIIG